MKQNPYRIFAIHVLVKRGSQSEWQIHKALASVVRFEGDTNTAASVTRVRRACCIVDDRQHQP